MLLKIVEFCCSRLDTTVWGSPIVQNGKVVGAVTHVLVKDSAKGYGIFLENMLNHGKKEGRSAFFFYDLYYGI